MSFLEQAAGRLKPSLETMVAAGAAIVTGAAVYLMPVDLLQNAVIASGLPEFLPPLDPPLGNRARIGLALVAAGFAFGLVALLVRLLIGKPKAKVSKTARLFERKRDARKPKPVAPVAEVQDAPSAPKLRWRDRHPDAPARAPLSIGREIGSPDEPPVRGFAKAEPVVAPEPVAEEPVFEIEPASDVVEEPVFAAPAFVEPEPVDMAFEPEVSPEPEPAPVATHPSWLDAGAPQPVEPREPTLAELLERLEAAMARRVPVVAEAAKAPVGEAPTVDNGADDRLRSALESLKRFAPGRG